MFWNAEHFRGKEGKELGKILEPGSVCDLFRGQNNKMACSMSIPNQFRLGTVHSWWEVQYQFTYDFLWAELIGLLLGLCPGATHRWLSWWHPHQACLWLPRLWYWVMGHTFPPSHCHQSVSYKRPPSIERAISLSGNQFSAVVGSKAGRQIHSGWLSSWSKSREKNAILFLADELMVGEKC